MGADAKMGVVPVNIPSFTFPTGHYYTDVLPSIWPGVARIAQDRIQSFFKRIAVPLVVHASDHVLEISAAEVLKRIPRTYSLSPEVTNVRMAHNDLLQMTDQQIVPVTLGVLMESD